MASDPVQLASILVRQWEGFREKAYQDAGGIYTVGFGFTGKDVGPTTTMTMEQAEERLKRTLAWLWERIDRDLGRDLTPNQGAAVLSLGYNIGLGALQRSTLWHLLQDGQMGPAAEQFTRWDKVNGVVLKGLQERRKAEKALFLAE